MDVTKFKVFQVTDTISVAAPDKVEAIKWYLENYEDDCPNHPEEVYERELDEVVWTWADTLLPEMMEKQRDYEEIEGELCCKVTLKELLLISHSYGNTQPYVISERD